MSLQPADINSLHHGKHLVSADGDQGEEARDRGFIERSARGDPTAFAELVQRHRGRLRESARRILGSKTDAEDVVQEGFLRAWRQARRYDIGRGNVSAWLTCMVRSIAIDAVRRNMASKRLPAVDVTGPDAPPSRSEQCRERLQAGMAGLPEAERRVIDLAYFEGLSHGDIARVTKIPLGTIKTRLRKGLSRLRLSVPRSVQDQPLIDHAQLARQRVANLLKARLLPHAADMYMIDMLTNVGRLRRLHWGHVDSHRLASLDDVWRFVPDRCQHQHPVSQTIQSNLQQFVPQTSEPWRQRVCVNASHLSFLRMLEVESFICQPILRDGRIVGALSLARTKESLEHFTVQDALAAPEVAADIARLILVRT